jgi:hypothetical protein
MYISNEYTPKEKELIQMGLVDRQTKSKLIDVHLVYAIPFNFIAPSNIKCITVIP